MIYIATTHFNQPRWATLQLQHFREHLHPPHEFFAAISGLADSVTEGFHHRFPAQPKHWDNLNFLAERISEVATPEDILVFVDSDAFPIRPLGDYLTDKLSRYPLIAVRRLENWYDPSPHPLFCATTVGFWNKIQGDWSEGVWQNSFEPTKDVGGKLHQILENKKIDWFGMRRSNRGPHGSLFSVYDGVIYHHGAGSRRPYTRYDRYLAGMTRENECQLMGGKNSQLFRAFAESNRETSEKILPFLESSFLEQVARTPSTLGHGWTANETIADEVKTLVVLGAPEKHDFWGDRGLKHVYFDEPIAPPSDGIVKRAELVMTLPSWHRRANSPGYLIEFQSPLDAAKLLEQEGGPTLEEGLELWRRFNARILSYYHLIEAPFACLNRDDLALSTRSIGKPFERTGCLRYMQSRGVTASSRKTNELPSSCAPVYRDLLEVWRECVASSRKVGSVFVQSTPSHFSPSSVPSAVKDPIAPPQSSPRPDGET